MPQSVIPRGLAYLIDTAVVAVLTAVLMATGVIQGGDLETFDPDVVREMLRSNSGLGVLILFAYFRPREGLTGRTVGKVALGLRVVRLTDGGPCGWSLDPPNNSASARSTSSSSDCPARWWSCSRRRGSGRRPAWWNAGRAADDDPRRRCAAVIPASCDAAEPAGGLLRRPARAPAVRRRHPRRWHLRRDAPFGAARLAAARRDDGRRARPPRALRAAAQEVLAAESAYGAALGGRERPDRARGAAAAGRRADEVPGSPLRGRSTPTTTRRRGSTPAVRHPSTRTDSSTPTMRPTCRASTSPPGAADGGGSAASPPSDLDAALATARVTLEQVTARGHGPARAAPTRSPRTSTPTTTRPSWRRSWRAPRPAATTGAGTPS